ncbi:hypothetical protein AB2E70_19720 [Escherichia coli]
MLGGADNPNGELPSYITGADNNSSRVPRLIGPAQFNIVDSYDYQEQKKR